MKTIVTIEARMGSTRLPKKVLLDLCGAPVLQRIIERLQRCTLADNVVVATSVSAQDDPIEELCKELDCSYFRGSEEDVLDRLIQTGRHFSADIICQCTGDCPLIDPSVCDRAIQIYNESEVDYVSNRLERSYPSGVDPQVFHASVLDRIAEKTVDSTDREHGSSYIYTHPRDFTMKNFKADEFECPEKRWLLDYPEDYEFMKAVFEKLYPQNPKFNTSDVLALLEREPELEMINNMYPVDLTAYQYYEVLPSG